MFAEMLSIGGGGGGGSYQFSTTEQKTGLKWTDGKDIYAKTFTATSITSPYTIPLPTGYEKIIDWTTIMDIAGGNNNVNNGYFAGGTPAQCYRTYTYNGNFIAEWTVWGACSSIHITLYYTKTSA